MFEESLPPPIHWYEGMFLQPHHLQRLARYGERLLGHRARLLSPYAWGVHRLRINEDGVPAGRFAVEDIDAVLPDGTPLETGLLARPLVRELAPFEERLRDGETLQVYLAVPEPGPKAVELEPGEDVGYPLRWRAQPAVPLPDETTGGNEVPVAHLKLNAQLLVGDEDHSGQVVLPLSEVAYAGDSLQLTDYIPPMVLVTKASLLADLVRSICQRLRGRAMDLAGTLDAALAHGEKAKSLESRFQAFGLVAGLLPLEQMVEMECFHPLDLYLALCRVLGEASTLSRELVPRAAPRYEHLDLRGTFTELRRRIDEAVRPTEPNYIKLQVRESNGAFEVLDLAVEQLRRPIYIVVRGDARSDPAAVSRWMEKNCTICPKSKVREHVRLSVPGIDRILQDPPPLDLPVLRGSRVYRLELTKEYLEALQQDLRLCAGRTRPILEIDGQPLAPPRIFEVYVKKERISP